MGCATGMVKYLVFLANLIFALAGLALVIIGVLYKLNYSKSLSIDSLPAQFGLAPILSIIIGSIVFVTAFLGCCGAVKESPCMLTTFAIILLTIFIVQVAIGIYAFLQIKDKEGFRITIHDGLQKTFDKYSKNEEAQETVKLTQSFLNCCGVDGASYWKWENNTVPTSCCSHNVNPCSPASPYLYDTGCTNALLSFLEKSTKIIGGVAIGIAATEIIGAIFGLCLASSIRNHYRRNIYA